MVNKLSHIQALNNLELIERKATLEPKNIHTYGVRGNKIVLITSKDGFLTRIWNSFLKFLRFIKTDKKNLESLENITVTHTKQDDYKKWAEENGKATTEGIKRLMSGYREIVAKLHTPTKDTSPPLQDVGKEVTELKQHLEEQYRGEIDKNKLLISELETKNSQLRKELDTALDQNDALTATSEENSGLRSQLDAAFTENSNLITKVDEYFQENQKLHVQNEEANRQIADLKKKADSAEDHQPLKEAYDKLKKRKDHYKKEHGRLMDFLGNKNLLDEALKAVEGKRKSKHSKKSKSEKKVEKEVVA